MRHVQAAGNGVVYFDTIGTHTYSNVISRLFPITCFKSILTVMTLLYIEDNIIHLPLRNWLNIVRWSDPAKTAQKGVMLSGHDTVR